jgi:probable F420-dependent oxidoreductase
VFRIEEQTEISFANRDDIDYMKIGISIPNNWGVENPQQLVDLAMLADACGYDSLWVTEHLLNIGYIGERLGNKPYYHSLGMLAYIAARTSRIALGTSVVVLPFRNPADLAKFAATIDQLSGGRLILGVGTGALQAEFEALGIPYKERGAITNETMQVMKVLWTQERARFHGKYWNFDDILFSPKPVQKPHVPLWVAGMSRPAYRRAGTLGDGWHATGIPLEEFCAGRNEIRRFAAEAGRDPAQITMSMRINVSYGSNFTTETERRSVLDGDDLDAMVAAITEWRDAGVEHLILAPATTDMAQLRVETERIAQTVLPRFR